MPGGYLSFGIYQALGGEREFGEFWKTLGFPVILLIALSYLLVDRMFISQTHWAAGSIVFIFVLAVAVFARMIH